MRGEARRTGGCLLGVVLFAGFWFWLVYAQTRDDRDRALKFGTEHANVTVVITRPATAKNQEVHFSYKIGRKDYESWCYSSSSAGTGQKMPAKYSIRHPSIACLDGGRMEYHSDQGLKLYCLIAFGAVFGCVLVFATRTPTRAKGTGSGQDTSKIGA